MSYLQLKLHVMTPHRCIIYSGVTYIIFYIMATRFQVLTYCFGSSTIVFSGPSNFCLK